MTMGGEQIQEKEGKEENQEVSVNADSAGSNGSAGSAGSAGSEETPGELPQCMMGNRKVDNMCFMISCTNWY